MKKNSVETFIPDFFHKILGPLIATEVGPLLHEPEHFDERVNLLSKTFDRHMEWIMPFRTLVKSLNPELKDAPLEDAIRFFTTKHTRLWLLVNLFNRALNIKELKLDEESGRLPAKGNDILKFAVQAMTHLGEESRYKDTMFAAGLIFDFLFYLQKTPGHENSKIDETLNQAFKVALDSAKKATLLAKYKGVLSLEKFTPALLVLKNAVPAALVLLDPTKSDLLKTLDGLKFSDPTRTVIERRALGMTLGQIAALFAAAFPVVFGDSDEALSLWGQPYLGWRSGKRDLHDLVGMAILSAALTERISPNGIPNGIKASVLFPELTYLDFTFTAEVKNAIKT